MRRHRGARLAYRIGDQRIQHYGRQQLVTFAIACYVKPKVFVVVIDVVKYDSFVTVKYLKYATAEM
jgi:hypothetical protein